MNAPQYWRESKGWSQWLGRSGKVVASTYIRVAPAGLESLAPYSFVIVEFADGQKAEFLGAGHETFLVGDSVRCVLRRSAEVDAVGVLPYGIKVVH